MQLYGQANPEACQMLFMQLQDDTLGLLFRVESV